MNLRPDPARLAARLPRRTVRLRLTALYGGLFLASGTGLLAITNILARSLPGPVFHIPAIRPRPALGARPSHTAAPPPPTSSRWRPRKSTSTRPR